MSRAPSSERPIIGAVDVFERSPPAVRCAAWLAEATGARVELAYVLDPGGFPTLPRMDPGARSELYEQHEEKARAHALEQLEGVAEDMPGDPPTLSVLEGRPVETLQRRAAEREAALVVTGTAAVEGLDFLMHGSVPARLAAVLSCPLVVAPPAAAVADPGPVLVGDDDSDESRRAVHHASAIAGRLGREMMRVRVEEGDPVTVIGDAGRLQQACLLVTGHRGRGPLRTALFGSVTAGLVQTGGRPVMVVPPGAGA
jgi:nucleotide-binding universal stress UspA family protein